MNDSIFRRPVEASALWCRTCRRRQTKGTEVIAFHTFPPYYLCLDCAAIVGDLALPKINLIEMIKGDT